jgi:hypothetical protein
MVLVLRWILGSILLCFFLFIASANASVIWQWHFKRKYISWVPIFGGFFGFVSFKILPAPFLNKLSWIPFLLDLGSAPLIFLAFYKALIESVNAQRSKNHGKNRKFH